MFSCQSSYQQNDTSDNLLSSNAPLTSADVSSHEIGISSDFIYLSSNTNPSDSFSNQRLNNNDITMSNALNDQHHEYSSTTMLSNFDYSQFGFSNESEAIAAIEEQEMIEAIQLVQQIEQSERETEGRHQQC